jgi:hypothetical protein
MAPAERRQRRCAQPGPRFTLCIELLLCLEVGFELLLRHVKLADDDGAGVLQLVVLVL